MSQKAYPGSRAGATQHIRKGLSSGSVNKRQQYAMGVIGGSAYFSVCEKLRSWTFKLEYGFFFQATSHQSQVQLYWNAYRNIHDKKML